MVCLIRIDDKYKNYVKRGDILTRTRSGNWDRDYTTAMNGGIPEERRRLLIDRGILSEEDNEIGREYTISCDVAVEPPIESPWGELGRLSSSISYNNLNRHTLRDIRSSRRNASLIYNEPYPLIYNEPYPFKYIEPYNYKPDKFNFNRIYGSDDIKPYLGIELEVDKAGKNDDNAKMVIDILGANNVYCKHDGSLDNGFEIVTHPCTLDYHLNMNYQELFEKLIGLNYRSHDTVTCGLHIHFNKNYFGESKTIQDLCITKLLYLFEKYWDNIAKFSRRDNNKYASRYGMEKDDSMFEVLYKAKAAKESYNGKYRSINLKNENTVEIRVFKGTLKYNTFIATLQFVNKLVMMCRESDLEEIQLITWKDIIKDADKDLKQYLEERKLS